MLVNEAMLRTSLTKGVRRGGSSEKGKAETTSDILLETPPVCTSSFPCLRLSLSSTFRLFKIPIKEAWKKALAKKTEWLPVAATWSYTSG